MAKTHVYLAKIHLFQNTPELALSHAREGVALYETQDPSYRNNLANSFTVLGRTQQRLGHHVQAKASLERALSLVDTHRGNNSFAYQTAATALLFMGDVEGACHYLDLLTGMDYANISFWRSVRERMPDYPMPF